MTALARRSWAGLAGLLVTVSLVSAPAAEAGQRVDRKIRVGGIERTYTVILPNNPKARASWPVIFAFHPAVAQGRWMRTRTKLHATRSGGNYVVVYPDGYYPTWNAGDCCGRAHREGIDDLGFFNAMRKDVASLIPIESKAYLTGFSGGSQLVYHILCNQPQTVAAVVGVGATRNMDRCRSGRVPVMHIHGDRDRGSPVEGGYGEGLFAKDIGYMEPAAKMVRTIARRNGCGTGATKAISKPRTLDTTCSAYTNCPGAAVSMLCVVPRMGHAWPGAPKGMGLLGPFRPDLNASAEVMAFFDAHR
ncbi:alpha/beta hydrolase family esterase [Rhodovulum adriaticum]|nr:hypothetical protein [Rhodovulum adriaticum]MBK1637148.1 hypothetical protein [Rhodovulum adriaticum]